MLVESLSAEGFAVDFEADALVSGSLPTLLVFDVGGLGSLAVVFGALV